MIPLRLVIDNSVLVSAVLKPDGLQRTVFLLATAKPARWYVSDPIMEEYAAVLARPELKIRKNLRLQLIQLIKNHTYTYSYSVIPSQLPQLTTDPDDNIFLECADAARADYLVTGNQRHFPRFWKKTKVINSREFLDIVAPHLS
jgi:putative PIN family toxin of toxin-antitoxin system